MTKSIRGEGVRGPGTCAHLNRYGCAPSRRRGRASRAVREMKDFPERTVLLASGQPVSKSAAVPVMPSVLTVCCGEGRSMLSV
jgi:hypothetical protein